MSASLSVLSPAKELLVSDPLLEPLEEPLVPRSGLGVGISRADSSEPWAQKAMRLGLMCFCFDCLQAAGVTPHGTADRRNRRSEARERAETIATKLVDRALEAAA